MRWRPSLPHPGRFATDPPHKGEGGIFDNFSLTDAAGLVGVLMMLGAYAAAQAGSLDPVKVPSLLLNLGGSCLVMLSLVWKFNFAAFVMEASWALVALFGLARALIRRRRGR